VLSIKRWAKFHEINDASQKTVSSYSFALMAIFYMQKACSPPILPCLQKLYPGKFSTKTNITTLRLNEPLEPWTSQNKQSLGEVFNGFLDYYSTFE
jgi:poly(A) RNA polymerase GLD2